MLYQCTLQSHGMRWAGIVFEEFKISILIPVHNSSQVIRESVLKITEFFKGFEYEVILIENGSTDDSFEICSDLESRFAQVKVYQSGKGLGNAIRRGIQNSSGDWILITADELPFEFDDVSHFLKLSRRPTIVIGSKAHPESKINRGYKRALSSNLFRFARWVILGSRVGDSQGSLIVNGPWLRKIEPRLSRADYLLTTEIVEKAEIDNLEILEVPVELRDSHDVKPSSIRFMHLITMFMGLWAIRFDRLKK